jgi:hypothetical protein
MLILPYELEALLELKTTLLIAQKRPKFAKIFVDFAAILQEFIH